MEICKAPTLRLKALNKHSITHIMYIEMENVENNVEINTHARTHARTRARARAHTHTHTHTPTHTHTGTLYRLIGVKDNVATLLNTDFGIGTISPTRWCDSYMYTNIGTQPLFLIVLSPP